MVKFTEKVKQGKERSDNMMERGAVKDGGMRDGLKALCWRVFKGLLEEE